MEMFLMKCLFLREGFGFPECYSIFKEPLYPLEFRYEDYCTKENHVNCPFYQAAREKFVNEDLTRQIKFCLAA